MSLQQVRFLHTSDWLLEMPLGGVSQVPTELREPFIDAPYLAAERVVQAALDHHVDFVLLAGNILSVESATPYTFEFLLRQFQRLDEQSIPVYWLGGQADDLDLWPAQLSLPKSVKLFPSGQMHAFEIRRDGKTLAQLVGQSQRRGSAWQASDHSGGAEGVPRIAVGCGTVQKRSLENKGVDYWALGGEERHHVVLTGKCTAAYSGSPQGRSPLDLDTHGALLVELQFGQAKTRLLETDVYRWRREKIVATEAETVESIVALINRQLAQIPADGNRFSWLLDWNILAQGKLAQTLFGRDAQERLLRAVNQTTANDNRWSLNVGIEPIAPPADLLEEDTILGDFLRCVQRFELSAETWHELVPYLPESDAREVLIAELQQGADTHRQQLWRRVAAFGADLLRGEVAVEPAMTTRVR